MGFERYLPSFVTEFMTEHRGWFVIVFVLPISLLYDIFYSMRAWIIMKAFSAPDLHEQRVLDVQKQILQWRAKNDGTELCTARGGWQSVSPSLRTYKAKSSQISINFHD